MLDLSEFRQHIAGSYSHTGRPSIDPELMIRMLIIGYCYGIRSERRLCEEVGTNLAYRWFCRLGLKDKVPDHSSFSRNRHGRFCDSDAFRELFDSVVRRCIAEGLVRGEGFATDASIIKADAQRQHGKPGEQTIDWGRSPASESSDTEFKAHGTTANIDGENPASAIGLITNQITKNMLVAAIPGKHIQENLLFQKQADLLLSISTE